MFAKAPHPRSATRGRRASTGALSARISTGLLSVVFLFSVSLPLSVSADTNGPGTPVTTFPFANLLVLIMIVFFFGKIDPFRFGEIW